MKYLIWINSLLLIVLTQFSAPHQAHACSGIGLWTVSLDSITQPGVIAVRGRIAEYISTGHARLLVDEYLIGEPGYSYVQVASYEERRNIISSMGYQRGGCTGLHDSLRDTHHEYIFFLRPRLDGTYALVQWITFDDTEQPPIFIGSDRNGSFEMTEQELLEYINADPQSPVDAGMEFPWGPRSQPILILDELGNTYLFPTTAQHSDRAIYVADAVLDVQISETLIALTRQDQLTLYNRWIGNEIHRPWPDGVDCGQSHCLEFSENGALIAVKTSPDTFQICEFGFDLEGLVDPSPMPVKLRK